MEQRSSKVSRDYAVALESLVAMESHLPQECKTCVTPLRFTALRHGTNTARI
jgi:hypothetical protein